MAVKEKVKKGLSLLDGFQLPEDRDLTAEEISKLLGMWEQVNAKRIMATAELREDLQTLQARLANIETPYKAALDQLEVIIGNAIKQRGSTEGIVSDVKVVFTQSYERRSVDLDGLWGLKQTMPKVYKAIKEFLRVTTIEARVKIGDRKE